MHQRLAADHHDGGLAFAIGALEHVSETCRLAGARGHMKDGAFATLGCPCADFGDGLDLIGSKLCTGHLPSVFRISFLAPFVMSSVK